MATGSDQVVPPFVPAVSRQRVPPYLFGPGANPRDALRHVRGAATRGPNRTPPPSACHVASVPHWPGHAKFREVRAHARRPGSPLARRERTAVRSDVPPQRVERDRPTEGDPLL